MLKPTNAYKFKIFDWGNLSLTKIVKVKCDLENDVIDRNFNGSQGCI